MTLTELRFVSHSTGVHRSYDWPLDANSGV